MNNTFKNSTAMKKKQTTLENSLRMIPDFVEKIEKLENQVRMQRQKVQKEKFALENAAKSAEIKRGQAENRRTINEIKDSVKKNFAKNLREPVSRFAKFGL